MTLAELPPFDKDGHVHVVIESPRGSAAKFKYDAQLDALALSRPLVDGVTFPYDWGFIPSTRGPDGDPLDALVIWDRASYPGVVLACRAIALLAVEQNSKLHPGTRERNDRVLAVPAAAPKFLPLADVGDIPERVKQELEAFFVAAVALEHKALTVVGWKSAEDAYKLIQSSTDR